MSDSTVHLLVIDGFADWEPAFALAGLRHWGGMGVRTVGMTRDPVTTMGGLRVLPETTLAELHADRDAVRLFMLPGGDVWEQGYPAEQIEPKLRELAEAGVPIAAICGATIAAARAGLLRGRRHTSNTPTYLTEFAAGSTSRDDFVDELAVRDRGVITASGLGAVEFAREIFAELEAFPPPLIESFVDMYKHGRIPRAMA